MQILYRAGSLVPSNMYLGITIKGGTIDLQPLVAKCLVVSPYPVLTRHVHCSVLLTLLSFGSFFAFSSLVTHA